MLHTVEQSCKIAHLWLCSQYSSWYHLLNLTKCTDVSDDAETLCLVALGYLMSSTLSTSPMKYTLSPMIKVHQHNNFSCCGELEQFHMLVHNKFTSIVMTVICDSTMYNYNVNESIEHIFCCPYYSNYVKLIS